ncbi:redoxin family protein [Paludisphaera mucosa]|uniref:Redoxin domain-containing protein n=1 Tax=Paludisphaera mucosa TaxID=3030827 RepID=A0ABT6F4S1_9BACT|nr:redoxin family protein [Paludisphaera mucosa]MDG3002501.1 redoxin domain-containing protein [Paludisphaera mucosa]
MANLHPSRSIRLVAAIATLLASAAVAAGDDPRPAPPTFAEDVAAIVFDNCTSCHRPGEGTPFSLMSYRDVKKRGALIRDVAKSGYMPPWPPAKGWGHFQDERRLTEEQVALIDRWVESGMAEGPAEKTPPTPRFREGGWALGEPDLVVTLPEAFDVPADGPDVYRMFVLPLEQSEDRWVTAVEIRPTARAVVHHALYFLDSTGSARKLDEADPGLGFGRMGFPRTGSLGGWAVGATPRHLPQGLAFPLAKGSDLVVQMHFHPSGKPEREQTSLGLYFAKEPPKKKLMGVQAPMAFGIATELGGRGIEPGDKAFTIRGEWQAPFDVDVVAVGGHAHYLCKTMKAVAELPDGGERKLFAIEDWDFNWQGRYNYAEPVRLPKGTVVRTTLVYDNSKDNPRNPSNPPVHVRWGEASTDEMGAVTLVFVAVDEADAAGYRAPTLFGGGRPGGNPLRDMDPERMATIFHVLDADRDGKLQRDEVPERLRPFMGLLDADRDGALKLDEFLKARGGGGIREGLRRLLPPGDAPSGSAPAATDPTIKDLSGRGWRPLRPAEGTKANVLFFVAPDCPVANQYAPEIGRIARDYAGRPVSFLLVHVDPDVSSARAAGHAREHAIDLPILLDGDHVLVGRTGATTTPEAAVIAADGAIAYRGRIDDRFGKLGRQRPEPGRRDLRGAIDAVLEGRPVAEPRVEAIGCPIVDLKR